MQTSIPLSKSVSRSSFIKVTLQGCHLSFSYCFKTYVECLMLSCNATCCERVCGILFRSLQSIQFLVFCYLFSTIYEFLLLGPFVQNSRFCLQQTAKQVLLLPDSLLSLLILFSYAGTIVSLWGACRNPSGEADGRLSSDKKIIRLLL